MVTDTIGCVTWDLSTEQECSDAAGGASLPASALALILLKVWTHKARTRAQCAAYGCGCEKSSYAFSFRLPLRAFMRARMRRRGAFLLLRICVYSFSTHHRARSVGRPYEIPTVVSTYRASDAECRRCSPSQPCVPFHRWTAVLKPHPHRCDCHIRLAGFPAIVARSSGDPRPW